MVTRLPLCAQQFVLRLTCLYAKETQGRVQDATRIAAHKEGYNKKAVDVRLSMSRVSVLQPQKARSTVLFHVNEGTKQLFIH